MRVLLLIFLIQLAVVTGLSVLIREGLSVAAGGIGVSIVGALMSLRHLMETRRLKPLTALAVAAGAGCIATLGTANLPLRVAFECYRDRFEALAQNVRAGEEQSFPCRIGPFVIAGGDTRAKGVVPCLRTGGSRGRVAAFVRDPEGRGCRIWSLSRLDQDWSYVVER